MGVSGLFFYYYLIDWISMRSILHCFGLPYLMLFHEKIDIQEYHIPPDGFILFSAHKVY